MDETAICVLGSITTRRKSAVMSAKNAASVGHIAPQTVEGGGREIEITTRKKDTEDLEAKRNSPTTEPLN